MSKAYPSNLTHAQYEFLSDMIPETKPGGRKREVDIWSVLNAIFYVRSSWGTMASAAWGLSTKACLCTLIFATGAGTELGCSSMIVCENGRESKRNAIRVHQKQSLIVKV